jgi:hypothetical protein
LTLTTALRLGIASVWLVFGLGFKVLGLVPRHRAIVASVVGEDLAGAATIAIGCAEALLGVWVLTGIRPRACAAAQTAAIASMNALELRHAREHLLAPVLMLCVNAIFIVAIWYWALKARATPETT